MLTVALVAAVVAILGGALQTRERRSPNAVMRRQLKAAPRTKIGELPESQVCSAVGRTRPLEMTPLLHAPLSGRPCFYYVIEAEMRERGSWVLIARERQGVPFVIQDASGRAVIEPAEARIDIEYDLTDIIWANPHPREHQFIVRVKPDVAPLLYTKQVRFREAIIGPDELVSVLGAGVREPDPLAPPSESYRGEPMTRLRFSRAPEAELLVSAAKETIIKVGLDDSSPAST
jgi:hypothetical protein